MALSSPVFFIVERSCVSEFMPDPNDKEHDKNDVYTSEHDAYCMANEFMICDFADNFCNSEEEQALRNLLIHILKRADIQMRRRCELVQNAIEMAGPTFGENELNLYTVREIKLVCHYKKVESLRAFALTTLVATKEEVKKQRKKTKGAVKPPGRVTGGGSTSRSRSTKTRSKK